MYSTCRFVVSGRVQGVGFRAAACDRARSLAIAGWVRNRADGHVEVRAAGDDGALGDLHDWLQQGPPAARVDRVEQLSDVDDNDLPQPFSVR